jgi:protein-S-isoprenylcysteine O-methyltransferase Ste14
MPTRALALVKSAMFLAAVPGTGLVWLPWFGLRLFALDADRTGLAALRWLGIVPLVAGAIVLVRCVFAFAWEGRGTPLPLDAPRRLVVSGFYRYVRNPMYIGVLAVFAGEWALFGERHADIALYMAIGAGFFALFVLLYEEPALRARFGDQYEEYRRNVPRWIPRRTPWRVD